MIRSYFVETSNFEESYLSNLDLTKKFLQPDCGKMDLHVEWQIHEISINKSK